MGIHVGLNHRTTYRYDRLISLAPQIIRLRPCVHSRTPIHSYSIRVLPEGHFENWQQDPHGNFLLRAVFPEKVREFSIEVDLVAEMVVINPFDFFVEEYAESRTRLRTNRGWLAKCCRTWRWSLPARGCSRISRRIDTSPQNTVRFPGETQRPPATGHPVRHSPGTGRANTRGNTRHRARDRAATRPGCWCTSCDNLGLAARFVSGYLIQLTPDIKSLDGPSGPEQDFTDLHAWTEAYIPGAGWIGLDPDLRLDGGRGAHSAWPARPTRPERRR